MVTPQMLLGPGLQGKGAKMTGQGILGAVSKWAFSAGGSQEEKRTLRKLHRRVTREPEEKRSERQGKNRLVHTGETTSKRPERPPLSDAAQLSRVRPENSPLPWQTIFTLPI